MMLDVTVGYHPSRGVDTLESPGEGCLQPHWRRASSFNPKRNKLVPGQGKLVGGGQRWVKSACFDGGSTDAATCTHTGLVGWQRGSAGAQATPVPTKAFAQSDCNLIIS